MPRPYDDDRSVTSLGAPSYGNSSTSSSTPKAIASTHFSAS